MWGIEEDFNNFETVTIFCAGQKDCKTTLIFETK